MLVGRDVPRQPPQRRQTQERDDEPGQPLAQTHADAVRLAASRTKNSYFQGQYRRLSARRGKKRAAAAVGHSQLVVAYHLLRDGTEYQDLGTNHFDTLAESQRTAPLVKRLEKLGYRVTLDKAA